MHPGKGDRRASVRGSYGSQSRHHHNRYRVSLCRDRSKRTERDTWITRAKPVVSPRARLAVLEMSPVITQYQDVAYDRLAEEARAAGLDLNWSSRIPYSRLALAAAETVRINQPGSPPGVQRCHLPCLPCARPGHRRLVRHCRLRRRSRDRLGRLQARDDIGRGGQRTALRRGAGS
jgi:hypothetical protein